MAVIIPGAPVTQLPLPYSANESPEQLAGWVRVYEPLRVELNCPAGTGLGTGLNGLAAAAHLAYAFHRPLALAPDDLWLAACMGLGSHIRARAEELREKLVLHEGAKNLTVFRESSFIPGNPANDWGGVVRELERKIVEAAPAVSRYMGAQFSTTGSAEAGARAAVTAAAMQNFFRFRLHTLCGIPEIRLLGGPEDWSRLREAVLPWAELGLSEWVGAVTPVYDQFVAASEGRADPEFWASLYKVVDTSGGPYISGWLPMAFPYTQGEQETPRPNPFPRWEEIQGRNFTSANFPPGGVSAPFQWTGATPEPLGMTLHGGFFGVSVSPEDGAVRPAQGWAVAPALDEKAHKKAENDWGSSITGPYPPKGPDGKRDWDGPEANEFSRRSREMVDRMAGSFKVRGERDR